MAEERLKKIRTRRRKLEKELQELREEETKTPIEVFREKGEISDSLEDLVCLKHPKARYIAASGSVGFSQSLFETAVCYLCAKEWIREKIMACEAAKKAKLLEEAKEELKALEEGKHFVSSTLFPGSQAYRCPNCNWVTGTPRREYYKSPPESWQALAGREGYVYHCRICNSYLGAIWLKVS
jgi:hypothetical protein